MPDLLGHTPPRPKFNDPAVIKAACEAMLPEVMTWTEQLPTEALKAETLEDLVQHYDLDGYRYARDLDQRRGWQSDRALVDILDGAIVHARKAHDLLVKEWVRANSVTVAQQIGDRVSVQRLHGRQEGMIERIDADKAELLVRRDCDAPGCGMLVPAESAERVAEAVA